MSNIEDIVKKLIKFRKDRDWEQFHKPKDLAISLSLEAAEVLEHFQWKSEEEIREYIKTNKQEIGDELADVFNWVVLLAHDLDIDLIKSAEGKIEINSKKYPIEKSKGIHKKYTNF